MTSPVPVSPPLLDPRTTGQITSMLEAGALSGGWLLAGPAHIGKATLAFHLAKVILSGSSSLAEADPAIATQIDHEGHPDLFILRRTTDEKTGKMRAAIRVDDVRDMISRMQRTSATGRRVAIVDPADAMNPAAANALLKTLEEPPAGTVMFLLSVAPGRLLPTIRSRCRQLDLREVRADRLSSWLADDHGIEKATAEEATHLSRGRPGRAVTLVSGEGREAQDMADRLLDAACRGGDIVAAARPFGEKGADTARREAQEIVVDRLSDAARAAAVGEALPGPFRGPQTPVPLISARDDIRALFADGDRLNADPIQTALAVAIRLGNALTGGNAHR